MTRLTISEPTDEAWQEWRKRCAAETKLLREAWESLVTAGQLDPKQIKEVIKVKALYGERKEHFRTIYRGLCAYCEIEVSLGQPGHLDHFRPKGRVKTLDGKIAKVFYKGKEIEHPGYFWLAYHWENLRFTCHYCNSHHTNTDGTRTGKQDVFPIDGDYVIDFDQLDNPILVDPTVDDPEEHLALDLETFALTYKTPRGKASIDFYGLNRPELLEARKRTFVEVVRDYCAFHEAKTLVDLPPDAQKLVRERAKKRILDRKRGLLPHTMVAKIAIAEIEGDTL